MFLHAGSVRYFLIRLAISYLYLMTQMHVTVKHVLFPSVQIWAYTLFIFMSPELSIVLDIC